MVPACAGAYTAATLGPDSVRISRTPNYDGAEEHVTRIRYGIMPTANSVSGSSLELLMDCLGLSDPCGQELPIRAALYDPLAADHWGSPAGTDSTYQPTLGYYGFDSATVQSHIASMQYAGIEAGISRWEGPGTLTDDRFVTLLSGGRGTGRWLPVGDQLHARGGRRPDAAADQIRHVESRERPARHHDDAPQASLLSAGAAASP